MKGGGMRILFLIIFLGFTLSCNKGATMPTKETVEKQMKGNLPIGTPFESVKAYLDNSKIGYDWYEKGNAFYSIIRDVKKNGPVSESIQVIIHMDNDKKVKSIEVKSVYTGP
jgi:hypothetical protein